MPLPPRCWSSALTRSRPICSRSCWSAASAPFISRAGRNPLTACYLAIHQVMSNAAFAICWLEIYLAFYRKRIFLKI